MLCRTVIEAQHGFATEERQFPYPSKRGIERRESLVRVENIGTTVANTSLAKLDDTHKTHMSARNRGNIDLRSL